MAAGCRQQPHIQPRAQLAEKGCVYLMLVPTLSPSSLLPRGDRAAAQAIARAWAPLGSVFIIKKIIYKYIHIYNIYI